MLLLFKLAELFALNDSWLSFLPFLTNRIVIQCCAHTLVYAVVKNCYVFSVLHAWTMPVRTGGWHIVVLKISHVLIIKKASAS